MGDAEKVLNNKEVKPNNYVMINLKLTAPM
jgi:hypothetical protein